MERRGSSAPDSLIFHMWTAPFSQVVCQWAGGDRRRVAFEECGEQGRGPPPAQSMPDHGGAPTYQHAAQSFVAGSRDPAEPDLARGRMIFRRQADPGRELASGSE